MRSTTLFVLDMRNRGASVLCIKSSLLTPKSLDHRLGQVERYSIELYMVKE